MTADPLDILLTFARLGLVSFGGANLPEIERVLVEQKGWITPQLLANGFALGQVMPGPNMLAMTHYGFAAGGWLGAFAATLGFYGPTALLSAAAMTAWQRLSRWRWLPSLRSALLPFGAGVLLAGVLVLARGSIHSPAGALIAAVSFGLLWRTRVNAALIVVGAAVLGAVLGL
ncbi:chromate transporter [Deinococcus arenae]|uniref:Chromate transporter n=1 Tax=Deinococcus arenae TaxID=1452751 RepID=A0A8H9L5A3_9DEIO|nr:chromate transporter [Deinococcus arenae]AWT35961.1 chromate transporter [Deinococcus actinosclerus]GGM30504.1 chromate transporter [Deinococcus arenae]